MLCNLVLSGGGARGFAHLGVIKAMQETGISFSALSATSSGAMVGVLLCDGYSVDEIAEICRQSLPLARFNYKIKNGWLNMDALNKMLEKYLRSKNFSQLKHPLHIALTNLNTGKQVIVNSGELISTVIASSSIPILFPSVNIHGVPYADGGLSGNLPVEPFIGSGLKNIGIHVNPIDNYNPELSTIRQFERIIHLSIRENVLREMTHLDLLLEPPNLIRYGLFDTDKMDEIIQMGYNYAVKKLKYYGKSI